MSRAETTALFGGGGLIENSYIRVLPDEFLSESVIFKFISKEISREEHEYTNIPPLPINALSFGPGYAVIIYLFIICNEFAGLFGSTALGRCLPTFVRLATSQAWVFMKNLQGLL